MQDHYDEYQRGELGIDTVRLSTSGIARGASMPEHRGRASSSGDLGRWHVAEARLTCLHKRESRRLRLHFPLEDQ